MGKYSEYRVIVATPRSMLDWPILYPLGSTPGNSALRNEVNKWVSTVSIAWRSSPHSLTFKQCCHSQYSMLCVIHTGRHRGG